MPMLNQEVIGPHVEGMYIVSDVNSAISNASMDSFVIIILWLLTIYF